MRGNAVRASAQSPEEKIKNAQYELPEGWRWGRLDDISDVNPKKTEVRDAFNKNIKVSFIPMSSLDETGRIIDYQVKHIKEVYKGYTYFKEGDIIFAKITPCMENGKCAIAKNLENKIGFGSTEFHVIRPNADIDKKWIWHILRYSKTKDEAVKHFTGAVGQKRVPESFLKNLLIPLPFKNNRTDLEKQKQIVEKIETIFKKVEQGEKLRQTALQKTKTAFDAVLNKIFKEAEEGKGWKWVRLGEKKYFNVETGGTPSTAVNAYWENGHIKWLTPKDLGRLQSVLIEDTERKITDRGHKNSSAKIIPKCSIVISTRAPIGHMAILKADMCFNQGCKGIIFNTDNISSKFVFYFLNINKEALNKLGQGATFKELSKASLEDFLIPLPFKKNHPDLEKQKQIVDYLDRLQGKIRQLEGLQTIQLQKFRALRESILNKAFRGEL